MSNYIELYARNAQTGAVYDGLGYLPVDDDFVEHLEERSYESLEIAELWQEWLEWTKENVDE